MTMGVPPLGRKRDFASASRASWRDMPSSAVRRRTVRPSRADHGAERTTEIPMSMKFALPATAALLLSGMVAQAYTLPPSQSYVHGWYHPGNHHRYPTWNAKLVCPWPDPCPVKPQPPSPTHR
jgi:hypothetical protein